MVSSSSSSSGSAKRIAAFKEKLATLSSKRSSSSSSSSPNSSSSGSNILNSSSKKTESTKHRENKNKKKKKSTQNKNAKESEKFSIEDIDSTLNKDRWKEKENLDRVNVLKSFRKHIEKNVESKKQPKGLFSQGKQSNQPQINKEIEKYQKHQKHQKQQHSETNDQNYSKQNKSKSKSRIIRNKPDFEPSYFEKIQNRLKKRRKNGHPKMNELDEVVKFFSEDFFQYSLILEKESYVVQESTYMLENAAERLFEMTDNVKRKEPNLDLLEDHKLSDETLKNQYQDNIGKIAIEDNYLESQSAIHSQPMEFSSQNTEFLNDTQSNSQLLFNEDDWTNNNFNSWN